jgi:hypothetical protein
VLALDGKEVTMHTVRQVCECWLGLVAQVAHWVDLLGSALDLDLAVLSSTSSPVSMPLVVFHLATHKLWCVVPILG